MESITKNSQQVDWQTKKLGEVCEVVNGGTPKTNIKKYWDGDILWITPKDMGRLEKIYVEETERRITKVGLDESSAKIIPPNSIILSTRAPIGHLAINTKEISTNQGCKGIIPTKNLDTKFLYYFLENSVELLNSLGSGTTFKELSGSKLKEVEIPLPSLAEQKRIVKILDDVFEGIEKAKENAEKNLKNSQELFESYLQNVFANPGKDWEEKTLGDICSLYQGIAINAKTKNALVEKSDLPLLRIKDLKNNTVEQYIDPNNYPVNALVNESDIIYTRTGSLGLVFRGKRGVLHNNSFKVVPSSELDKDFLFIWLQNPIFKSKIMGLALKAAQPDITHAIFKIQGISIPPLPEQKTIVKKLDALSGRRRNLRRFFAEKSPTSTSSKNPS